MVMRRAIAGVYTDKARRGEAKEMTADQKAVLAIKDALANQKDWEGMLAFGTEIHPEKVNFSPKGNLLKDKYQHNTYKTRGKVKVHLRDMKTDQIFEPKHMTFRIAFCDCLDSNGIPDLTVDSFELSPAPR